MARNFTSNVTLAETSVLTKTLFVDKTDLDLSRKKKNVTMT